MKAVSPLSQTFVVSCRDWFQGNLMDALEVKEGSRDQKVLEPDNGQSLSYHTYLKSSSWENPTIDLVFSNRKHSFLNDRMKEE